MIVRELKEFLADKDDLSEVIVDTYNVRKDKTSIFYIEDIIENNNYNSVMHNDIVIVL